MKYAKTIVSIATGLCLASTLSANAQCQSSASAEARPVALGAMGGHDIIDTAVSAGSFKTLAAALGAADLVHPLKGDGPFTVFAPTDEAFSHLPKGTVETLLKPENKALLTAILTYHVVPGRVAAADVVKLTEATTLNGQRVDIKVDKGVKIDDANVIKTDITCSNGVIHVIDRVIMPSTDNLIELAANAGSFQTLAAAVKAAGLAATLSGEGPFTVFAPTDEAFAKLPEGTLNKLLEPKNRDMLVAILKYHVVPGRVYASDAIQAQTAETAEGSRIRFGFKGGSLQVNDANIIMTDIEASNGVVHVIDEVILPG